MKHWSPTVTVLALCACSSSQQPPVECAKVGSGAPVYRVLIVGESWAAGGRILPELPQAVARRSKSTVLACSVGFSGKNTAKIIREFKPAASLRALGGAPTNVVILTGVNDQVQHKGAQTYAANVKKLASAFKPAFVQIVSAPDINIHPPLGILYRIKNRVYGVLHPEGNADYRRALSGTFPPSQVIDYAAFSSGADQEPIRYAPDRIHLTLTEFHKYGAFIGDQMRLMPKRSEHSMDH